MVGSRRAGNGHMIEIRTAHAGDIPAIDALLARSYPRLLKGSYAPSVLVTAIPRIARARPRLVTSGTYFVLENGGRIVAAGGWSRDRRDETCGNMRHFATDADHARQGFGRALGRYVLEDARAAGIRRMRCDATLMAVPFYEALGFGTVGAGAVTLDAGVTLPIVRLIREL